MGERFKTERNIYMNEIKLKRLLIEDLTTIGVPTDFNLNIKGYRDRKSVV